MKAAIFDLDGTLLNTLDDLACSCNYALMQEGLATHPTDAYRYFVGNGVAKLIERTVPSHLQGDTALLARLRAVFDGHYKVHGQDLTRPYEGVVAMLDELINKGYCLSILSNKPHDYVRQLVPHYFGERFLEVFGQRQGYPTKPDPSLVQELLERLDVSPEETCYVGDSGVDMQTGKGARLLTVGVLWGFRGREELLENGADVLISTPEEIFSVL